MNWGVFGPWTGRVRPVFPSRQSSLIYVHFRIWASARVTGISSARSLTVSRESFEVTVSGGSTLARVKLKEITEWHHKTWSVRFNLTQHGELYQIRTG